MVSTVFGIVRQGGRIIHRRKGRDDVDVTDRCVTIMFDGVEGSGKTLLMRAILRSVAPDAIVDDNGHRMIVIVDNHLKRLLVAKGA